MKGHILTPSAEDDVADILARSYRLFGQQGRNRYEALIFAAIADISRYPDHPASKRHSRYGAGVRSWHL